MCLPLPIKLDVAGYLHMKDVHKKHISLGYGFLFCGLLRAVWKSFWHLAFKDFLHKDEKDREIICHAQYQKKTTKEDNNKRASHND